LRDAILVRFFVQTGNEARLRWPGALAHAFEEGFNPDGVALTVIPAEIAIQPLLSQDFKAFQTPAPALGCDTALVGETPPAWLERRLRAPQIEDDVIDRPLRRCFRCDT
jgi:hypothetical protein